MFRTKTVYCLIFALCVFGLSVPHVHASTWLSGWDYRKSHSITAGTGAGTNYQIQLTVHYGSGTDSGSDVYLGGNGNTDFSDIRFTDDDGITLLDYWIEEKTDSDSATVWVEVADSLDSNQSIYLYYGNAGATSASSIKNTFVQAVDFSTDTVLSYGGSQDSDTDWSVDGSENYIRMGEGVGKGNNWKAVDVGTFNITSGDYMLEWEYKADGGEGEISGVGHDTETSSIEQSKTYQTEGTQSWGLQFGEVTQYDRGVGGWQDIQAVLDDYTGSHQYITIVHDNDGGPITDDYYRDIRVRKYTTTAPSSSSWGSEETVTTVSVGMEGSTYNIEFDSLNSAGLDTSVSSSYGLLDTVGEVGTGRLSSTSYGIRGGYRQMNSGQISITAPADVNMTNLSGITTDASTGSVTWTVTTDNPDGYELSIRSSTNPALQDSGQGYVIDNYTPATSDPDFTFSIANSTAEFGFSPEGDDVAGRFLDNGSSCNTGAGNTADRCWDAFSTSDVVISERATSNQVGGTDTTVKFQAQNGSDHVQEAGTYEAVITVTAVTL